MVFRRNGYATALPPWLTIRWILPYGGLNSDSVSGGAKADVHRVTLIHVDGEEVSDRNGGKANLKEAEVVCNLVERISAQCVKQGFSVLVTTPYATQTIATGARSTLPP